MKSHFVSPDLRPSLVFLYCPCSMEEHHAVCVEKSTKGFADFSADAISLIIPGRFPPSSLFNSRLAFMQSPPLHKALLRSKSLPAGRGIVSAHCPQICHANAASLLCQASSTLLLPLAQRSLENRIFRRYVEDSNLAIFLTLGQEWIISNCPCLHLKCPVLCRKTSDFLNFFC